MFGIIYWLSSPTRSANLEQLFWMGYWTDAVQCNYFMVHHHYRESISMIIFHFKCFEYVKSITLMTMYNTLRMLVHFLEPGASFMNHLVNERCQSYKFSIFITESRQCQSNLPTHQWLHFVSFFMKHRICF